MLSLVGNWLWLLSFPPFPPPPREVSSKTHPVHCKRVTRILRDLCRQCFLVPDISRNVGQCACAVLLITIELPWHAHSVVEMSLWCHALLFWGMLAHITSPLVCKNYRQCTHVPCQLGCIGLCDVNRKVLGVGQLNSTYSFLWHKRPTGQSTFCRIPRMMYAKVFVAVQFLVSMVTTETLVTLARCQNWGVAVCHLRCCIRSVIWEHGLFSPDSTTPTDDDKHISCAAICGKTYSAKEHLHMLTDFLSRENCKLQLVRLNKTCVYIHLPHRFYCCWCNNTTGCCQDTHHVGKGMEPADTSLQNTVIFWQTTLKSAQNVVWGGLSQGGYLL